MKFRTSGLSIFSTLVFFILLLSTTVSSVAQDIPDDAESIAAGEALFNANCMACHRVHQKLVGPALTGVETRTPSVAWIIDWVKNPARVIATGDQYAVNLYEEYNKAQMTAFTSLSNDQILDILAYVTTAPPPQEQTLATGGEQVAGGEPGIPSSYLNIIIAGIVIILVLLLVILGLIVNVLKKYLDQKELSEEDKEVVHSRFTFGTIIQSSGFIFLVVFVVSAIAFKTVVDGLYSIGVQQDYQPRQPIAFSHKIHAGQFEIDCQYCHTGVNKGRSANIPSPNICMNCHSQIKSGTNTGEAEIAKIYAAIENNQPIEWVRVHNLPDLAYFNHSQHVNVADLECQTCHGPIQEMEVVRQYSLLTMGWCINCHRTTDVNTRGNAYYDKLVELHDSGTAMKVEDIGGLECAKCHY